MTEWVKKNDAGEARETEIRGKLIPKPIMQILKDRGYDSMEKVENFFAPSLDKLHDPFLMPDMEKAARRLAQACRDGEPVLIHGDYDTDGITATALVFNRLKDLGANPHYFIPSRFEEGYGLSRNGIDYAARQGCRLVVAVDCGVTAGGEIDYARSLGIEVIVCDHHQPQEKIPAAYAVLDPKLPNSRYPFTELAGVGVSFKLIQALYAVLKRPVEEILEDLDLVALGSVVDVVPLIDENRCLVKYGIKQIKTSRKPAFQALLEETKLQKGLYSYHLGFILGPRINACGRLREAREALELFLTGDVKTAAEIARRLTEDNQSRQEIEDRIREEARETIERERLAERRVIVCGRESWHEGVIGIVASRISEEYHRPAILLAFKDKTAKGSGRSIAGFDIADALYACRDLLVKFGGHKQAAGLELERNRIPEFRDAVNEYADRQAAEIFQKKKYYDLKLDLKDISDEVVRYLNFFEPTGTGNPLPVFFGENFEVVGAPRVVGGKHLRFSVRQGDLAMPAIAFHQAEQILKMAPGKARLDCLYTVNEDSYGGKRRIELKIKEMTEARH
jgi:single-stranded-DNA-specific exonuclease